jgi:hypothetical protein
MYIYTYMYIYTHIYIYIYNIDSPALVLALLQTKQGGQCLPGHYCPIGMIIYMSICLLLIYLLMHDYICVNMFTINLHTYIQIKN